ncbi:peritrophin-48-like [Anastrepha obliqua]|uniref:peritrophin-48-like n=1 Tax=Anastrepha obliqua TaxID=95512 RepID=UPI0024094AA1|nr:peritrophin-48-like [Anastrepha obliqua]
MYTRTFCALALVVLCVNASAAVNMNNICLLLKENALVASGDSCSSYYKCSNGVASQKNCSTGLYFDKNSQGCVSKIPSYCTTDAADPCNGYAVGSFAAVAESCAGYYYCSSSGAERSNCPDDLIFNPDKQSCVYKSTYDCVDGTNNSSSTGAINLCSYVQNGIYFGNAWACAGWQKCTSNTEYTTGTCTNDLVFDPANAICNYQSAVSCSQVTKDPSLDVTSASNGGACTETGAKENATACNQYYLCNGKNWILTSCDQHLFYDVTSKECVNRMNAYNDCDRCVGTTTNTFVNAFGTNCTGYLYCTDGAESSSGICVNDMFFDEAEGLCVYKNPGYVFCADSSSTTTTTSSTTTTTDASTTSTAAATTDEATTTTTSATTTTSSADDTTTTTTSATTTTSSADDTTTTTTSATTTTVAE